MRKKNMGLFCITLVVVGMIVAGSQAAADNGDTKLFLTLDTQWEHAHANDTFVVRADVKNIGEHPALLTWIHLENIPDDWNVFPHRQLLLILPPGQQKARFFVVERGPTDATIYATAQAYNAPLVSSNRIPIPISIWILAAFAVVCGLMLYRETTSYRNQENNKPKKPV